MREALDELVLPAANAAEAARSAKRVALHAMALAGYNRLLGEPMERVPELAELPADTAAPLPAESVDALVERARASRRELAGLEARSLALAEQARSENASRWPQVGLMADYQHLENQVLDDEDFALLGVGFSWTLFDAGRIRQRANARAGLPPRTGTISSPAWRWKSGRRGSTRGKPRRGSR